MTFTTVVARVGSLRRLFRPFENRQLRVAAMDHNPSSRIFAFQATNFTSIDAINHPPTPMRIVLFPVLFKHLQVQRLFKQTIHLADARQGSLQRRGLARLHGHHERQRMRRIPSLLYDRPNVNPLSC
jgi:hypothetical protein